MNSKVPYQLNFLKSLIRRESSYQINKYGNFTFIFFLCFILLFSFFPLFVNLDKLPIRLFDESRLANSALEMNRTHEFLVVKYKGEPEMWSTKPPLMIWCQVIFMKLIGETEWAVRLPSAISGLLIILILYLFLWKTKGSVFFGLFSSLILVATPGFITEHGTRTGDYDAMLVLFLMLQFCCYYFYLEKANNPKILYCLFVFIILAVYTKGIAGFMLLPGLFLYTLYKKRLKFILLQKHFWTGILFTACFIFGYYLLREVFNPGYINKVIENEITYRYFEVNEGHVGDWNFYLLYLRDIGYAWWYFIAAAGILTIFTFHSVMLRNLVLYTAINLLVFLIIISCSETKIEWYVLPLFPLLAIMGGAFFYFLYTLVSTKFQCYIQKLKFLVLFLFSVLFLYNYSHVISYVNEPVGLTYDDNLYGLGNVFKRAIKDEINLDGVYYCYPNYNAHLHFYTQVLAIKGQHVTLMDQKNLQKGNKVLSGYFEMEKTIKKSHNTKVLASFDNKIQLLLIR